MTRPWFSTGAPQRLPLKPAQTVTAATPRAVWLHQMMQVAFIIMLERYVSGVPRLAVPPRGGDVRSLSVPSRSADFNISRTSTRTQNHGLKTIGGTGRARLNHGPGRASILDFFM